MVPITLAFSAVIALKAMHLSISLMVAAISVPYNYYAALEKELSQASPLKVTFSQKTFSILSDF